MKLLIGLLALSSSSAFATGADMIWCHNCSSADVEANVLNDKSPLGTIIYVGDTATNAVGAYYVYADVDDSKHPPQHVKYVANTTADSSTVELIHASIDFYNTSPVGWHKAITVAYHGSDDFKTVYQVVDTGHDQNIFNAWLNSNLATSLGTALGNATQLVSALHLIDQTALPSFAQTVFFADGSHIDGVFDRTTGTLKADPTTARDADNNNIPYLGADGKIHNLGGHFNFDDPRFGAQDEQNFLKKLQQLNVEVWGAGGHGSGTGGGVVVPWVCVTSTDDEGNLLYTCTSS